MTDRKTPPTAQAKTPPTAQAEIDRQVEVEKAVAAPAARIPDQREAQRQAELKRQADVVQAVHDATHDSAGNPIPLGVADHLPALPAPAGITIVKGKP